MSNAPNVSEATVVAELVTKHIAPQVIQLKGPAIDADTAPDEAPLLILPQGLQALSLKKHLDEYRTTPHRREGTAHMFAVASLIDHVNRFKDEDSALFAMADQENPTLLAVLDYHRRCNIPPGEESDDGAIAHVQGVPRFGRHRALYDFPLSDEWKAWLAKNGAVMSQADFASFLEDRITDVSDPADAFSSARRLAAALGIESFATPSRLLQLSRGLTIHVDERATNQINPSSGEITMHYQAEHNDELGAPLVVPRAFLIQISVFRAGDSYQLPVRLKYRMNGGRVTWFYELHDARKAFDDAFRAACERAQRDTELPLFYGAPEK